MNHSIDLNYFWHPFDCQVKAIYCNREIAQLALFRTSASCWYGDIKIFRSDLRNQGVATMLLILGDSILRQNNPGDIRVFYNTNQGYKFSRYLLTIPNSSIILKGKDFIKFRL